MNDLFDQKPVTDLSIVLPVYNEAANLQPLFAAIIAVLAPLGLSWECIFVDDGSKDDSLDRLKKMRSNDSRVHFISLSRNFGHQIALTAGIDHAKGRAVLSMDADLQHPPDLIPEMIRKWKEGYDVVYSVRRHDKKTGWFKNVTSSGFYWIIGKLSNTSIHPDTADFRLLSRRAADSLRSIRERDRFIRGLVSWIGFNQIAVPYAANPRHSGKSKYSFLRMMRLALDGLTSFSSAPLYLSTFFGFAVSGLSFLYMLVAIYFKLFTDRTIPGWTSILIVVLFLGGVQLISIGIMGEYVGRIYSEIKRRPLYLVKESAGVASPEPVEVSA